MVHRADAAPRQATSKRGGSNGNAAVTDSGCGVGGERVTGWENEIDF